MDKRISKKMGITMIVLTLTILITSGYLLLKVFLWNGYNEATHLEKTVRQELQKLQTDPENWKSREVVMEGLYRKGQYNEVKIQAEHLINQAKVPMATREKALYYRSLIFSIDGDYERALTDLQEILDQNKQFGEAWLSLARLYIVTGDIVSAEKATDKAVALLRDSVEPVYIRGQIHFINGEVEAAANDLERVLQQEPKHLQAKELFEKVLQHKMSITLGKGEEQNES